MEKTEKLPLSSEGVSSELSSLVASAQSGDRESMSELCRAILGPRGSDPQAFLEEVVSGDADLRGRIIDTLFSHLLERVGSGEAEAMRDLVAIIFPRLKDEVQRELRGTRWRPHELGTTSVVHEVYLRLVKGISSDSASYFWGAVRRAAHDVVVDRIRRLNAKKRGAGAVPSSLDVEDFNQLEVAAQRSGHEDLCQVLEILEELTPTNRDAVDAFTMLYFQGSSVSAIAACLKISRDQAEKKLLYVQAVVRRRMAGTTG